MKLDLTVGAYIVNDDRLLLIHHNKLQKWLPPGGHIDPNESPDEACLREVREEVNLEVEILHTSSGKVVGDVEYLCGLPFHTNIHSVGDHSHYCLFYLCGLKGNAQANIREEEVSAARWFSREEILSEEVPDDVRQIGLQALTLYREH